MLNLSVPEHLHGNDVGSVLWGQRQDLFAYAISFAVVGRFWVVHHRLYSVNLVGVVLSGSLMFADAHRAGLTRTSPEAAREGQHRALTIAAIFLASIPVAFVNPHLAPYCWLALFIPSTAGRLARRRAS